MILRLFARGLLTRTRFDSAFARRNILCCKARCSKQHWISSTNSSKDDDGLSSSSLSSSSSQVVDVTPLAESMRQQVRNYTQSSPRPVRLVGVLAQAGPFRLDAELYSERIAQTCEEDGIIYELQRCTGQFPANVEELIQTTNSRPDVDGILIFYPIFKRPDFVLKRGPFKNLLTGVYYKTYDDYLRDVVAKNKDVEGLCGNYNARLMFRSKAAMNPSSSSLSNQEFSSNDDKILPCTALSVKQILDHYHPLSTSSPSQPWKGQIVSVINRSEIMGRPLAAMLASSGATVYSIDVDSIEKFRQGGRLRRCTEPNITMQWCLKQSNVVVTGVPSPDFHLPSEWISPGTTVVNVSEFLNVCEETLLDRPGIRYIPQVGKVTVAVLEQNLLRLHRNAQTRDSR
jgi:methylenetetrahydrofolate dehydrogenase (NAD+)